VAGELRAGIGSPALVLDGHEADLVVLVQSGGARLVVAPQTEPLTAIDPTRRFAKLAVEDGEGEELAAEVGDRLAAAVAAEVVGVCQRALEMTLAYVKERRQFGVAIGSFQAVSHRCAEMLLHTESARSAAYYAAWAADSDPDRFGEAAALAAAAAATAAREVPAGAIQAHGGVGFTWEADVHWLYKRAQLDAALLGGAKRHRARLAGILAAGEVEVAHGV
ncbi:MAG: acyl-CoA dehydrogenase family protein, partial [Solirubrobacteraceae bacterium]